MLQPACLAAGVVLGVAVAVAAPPAGGQPLATPARSIGHLSVEQGLSQSTVTSLYQDRQGFLWIGTQDGLNRYDGARFTAFRTDIRNPASISDNYITRIIEDHRGRMWVGTQSGGLNLFDPATGRATRYGQSLDQPRHFGSTGILSIAEDRSGNLWLGTWGGGLSRFDPDTGAITTYVHDPRDPGSLANKNVWSVTVDHAGVVWAGSFGGLNRVDPATGRMTLVQRAPGSDIDLTGVNVSSLLEDAAGTLWVGTWGTGLVAVNRERTSSRRLVPDAADPTALADGRIWSLAEDTDHHLWVGTEKGGLHEFDGRRFTRHLQPGQGDASPAAVPGIGSLLVDRAGILWAGTGGTGLYKLLPPLKVFWRFSHSAGDPRGLPGGNVWSITELADGSLWVGTIGAGLSRMDPVTGAFTRVPLAGGGAAPPAGESIFAMIEQPAGRLVLSADTQGLFVVDPATRRCSPFPEAAPERAKLAGVRVMSLWGDSDGTVWLGTMGHGLYRVDGRSGEVTRLAADPANPEALASNSILTIRRTRDGILWLGTQADGLEAYANGRFTHHRAAPGAKNSLTDNRVGALYEDATGALWIGTWGGGLNRLAPDRRMYTAFTQRDGLPNDTIYGILDGGDGRLWLSTNNGLCRFTVAGGAARNYSVSDGILDREYNQGAYHRGRSGRLYFGGVNGLTAFRPAGIRDNPKPPPVAITAFTRLGSAALDGQQVPPGGTIHLGHTDSTFSVEFAALDFAAPEKNLFQYRLEGLDDDWSRPSGRSYVSYTKVPAGRYTLRVRAANSDGVWSAGGASLRIVVHPAWWATWLAYALYATTLAGATGLVWWRRSVAHRRELARQRAELEREREASRALRTAESAARTSEERFRRFMEWLPGIGFIKDAERRFVYVNRQFELVAGRTNAAMTGRRGTDFLQEEAAERMHATDDQVFATKEAVEFVAESASPDGPRYYQTSKFPIFDEQGRVAFIGGISVDITDKKRLEQQLLQAQKLESIGTLAGGIAHDFNNLLTIITGYNTLLRSGSTDEADAARCMNAIEQAVQRGASLVRQILTFAQRSDVSFRLLDLNGLVRELASMLRQTLPKTIQVEEALPGVLPAVRADQSQVHQALLNLAVNARDAMPAGGTLTFATRVVPAEEARAQLSGAESQPYVCVTVTDTGTGMDEATRLRVFEPFFTTKGPGRGTGLGLAVVYGVAQVHKGFVEVDSAVGCGTTFRLYLPATADEAPAEVPSPEAMPDDDGVPGTILVIEDETLVSTLLQRVLQRAGYTVLLAQDGQEGIDTFQLRHRDVDLVLMDFGLPGLQGDAVFDRLKAIDPAARIVVASGNLDVTIRARLEASGLVGFLQKPYTNHAVLDLVRRLVGR